MPRDASHMRSSTALTIVGSALLWAWGYLCYLSPVMFPYASVTSTIGIEYGFFVSQITSAAFALLVSLVGSRRQVVVPAWCFFAAAVAVSLSVVLIEGVLWGVLPAPLLYCAAVLDGIGVSLLGIVWGTRYCLGSESTPDTTTLILLSFLVAYGVYFAVSKLPQPWGAVITGVIPLLSWLAWRTDAARRHALVNEVLPRAAAPGEATLPGEVSLGDPRYSILPWRALSLIGFAAFTANLVASFVLGRSYSGTAIISGGVVVVTGIVAVVLMIQTIWGGALSIERIYRLVLPLAMVGLLAMLVLGEHGVVVGGSLINGCGMFMQCLVIMKVTESTRKQGISPLVSFGVGQGVVAFVVFAGNVGGKVLFSAFGFSDHVLNIFCALGVFVLFCMLLFLTRPTFLAQTGNTLSDDHVLDKRTRAEALGLASSLHRSPSGSQSGNHLETATMSAARADTDLAEVDIEAAAVRLAEKHGLTPRETEVLLRLARGRSLPYIADQLFVTTGTVKTHTIHIYRKLGISSKQELIDLVEAEKV